MNLSFLDWAIIAAYLIGTVILGLSVRKYIGKVEHFIVAGRHMDVYLGVASLAATEFGLVTVMYTAQLGYTSGFAGAVPGVLMAVAMLFVGLTGFCIKPLRQSAVMTLPELFQRKFGTGVHWLAGLVIVLGGLLNMGVFLRLGGQFLIHFMGLPENIVIAGVTLEAIPVVMTALLLLVLLYTAMGGMLSVLVTDYLQFIVLGAGLVVVTILVLVNTGWTNLVSVVETQYQAGGFNPIVNAKQGGTWLIWQGIQQLAVVLTWQTTIARVLASKDAGAARAIYTRTSFYFVGRFLLPGIWGMGALAAITAGAMMAPDDTLNAMPVYLMTIVPVGLMGLVIAAMLAAEMSTDSSYLLTWASVIYNDLILPLRSPLKKPFTQKQGLWLNRFIVICIGVFLLIYGLWYQIPGTAWDYLSITGSIYLSSISVLLISCLYWRDANRYGAYAAIIMGAATPLAFLFIPMILKSQGIVLPEDHWLFNVGLNGLLSYLFAALGMGIGSYLGWLYGPEEIQR